LPSSEVGAATTDSVQERRKRKWPLLLLLVPTFLVLIAFVIIPLVLVFRDSIAVPSLYGGTTSKITFSNYTEIFQSTYLGVVRHSLVVAAENTILCVSVGYCVAYWIATRPAKRQPMLILLLIVPFWTDFIVRTFTWINLLSSNGVLAGVLRATGLHRAPLNLIPSSTAVFIGLLYAFLPTAVFPIYAALRNSDLTLLEAAEDLGCGRFSLHRRIVLPLASMGVLASSLLIFVPTMGVYVITVLLGGGKQLLIGNLLEVVYLEFRDVPLGAAISIVMVLFMLIALGIVATVGNTLRKRVQ
jgi:spermidine/putrescine transport system permease protein